MNQLERFAFVLVRPLRSGNVGAAARALKNMGMSDLRLVAPVDYDAAQARAMAVHAADLLAGSRTYPDLLAALEDCSIAIGTTARGGPYRVEAQAPRLVAPELVEATVANRIAIIFGPEDSGLLNDDLKLCQRLIKIPTAPAYNSLNLAQAVLLVAYELWLAANGEPNAVNRREFAGMAELDTMLLRLERALIEIGFIPEESPDHIMFAIRALLGRGGVLARELDILNGLARQIRWFAEGGHTVLAQKKLSGRRLR